MQYVRASVSTIGVGQAASMAAVLLLAGAKGKRFGLPNCRVLLHQPSGGLEGQATDIDIRAKEILRQRHRLNDIISHHTGQQFQRVEADTNRDYFLGAAEARAYGIIDEIVSPRSS
ncbi:MAG: ATP-dependent Clp protease proteolytic subunit, partial [Myxococcaceae bacterium]|nr:ATP-dependent Clp protease proteolytic subunit [Myxococcaceae bacterium]